MSNTTIRQVYETSLLHMQSASRDNGAIVASGLSKAGAKNYEFVWIRDAAYICMAADDTGIHTIQKPFFDWCMRAELWSDTGLFFKNYTPEGRMHERAFQPDQSGSLLIALHRHYLEKDMPATHKELLKKTADALCKEWHVDHFIHITEDLWEVRDAFPDQKGFFSYSLAMCYRGLLCAHELFPNQTWARTARDMYTVLSSYATLPRRGGIVPDASLDASLLGVVWPAKMFSPSDTRIKRMVRSTHKHLEKKKRIMRHKCDTYDGWTYTKNEKDSSFPGNDGKIIVDRHQGAGTWPLLSLWMGLYYAEKGNKRKARVYLMQVVRDAHPDGSIPEQVFSNPTQKGVSPLVWAHALFIILYHKIYD
jgi:GH15 family glucan-1,4-alpha-glucosidase